MNKRYISLLVATVLLTACGGGSSSSSKHNDGEGAIDLSEYFPNKSMTKTFISTERYGDNSDKSHYDEIIEVNGNTITTTIDAEVTEKVVFLDKNITMTSFDEEEGDEVLSIYRHVDLGDTFLSEKIEDTQNNDLGKITRTVNQVCKIKNKETKFEKGDNIYTGDLLKIECIATGEFVYDIKQTLLDAGVGTDLNGTHAIYDTSSFYLQKDLGLVASINDDCIVNSKLPMVITDQANPSKCITKQYDYEFYIP